MPLRKAQHSIAVLSIAPEDLGRQARVNSVLGWHGAVLRTGATTTVFNRAIRRYLGEASDEAAVTSIGLPKLEQALRVRKGDYVAISSFAPDYKSCTA